MKQDSLGDVMYNLSADKIRQCNTVSMQCPECLEEIEKTETDCFDGYCESCFEENLPT